MIELLILFLGIATVYKFWDQISDIATIAEVKTQEFAEEVHVDATLNRIELAKEFDAELGDSVVISHEELMSKISGKKQKRNT
jgi:hypothetical protein